MRRFAYIAAGIVIAIACVHWFNVEYHNSIRSNPMMYCYDDLRGPNLVAPVILLEDIDLKNDYVSYYQAIEKGGEPYLPDDIPLKGLPQYRQVYVIGYSDDRQLAEVVSYYDRSDAGGGSYTRGWVYAKALHSRPPADADVAGSDL